MRPSRPLPLSSCSAGGPGCSERVRCWAASWKPCWDIATRGRTTCAWTLAGFLTLRWLAKSTERSTDPPARTKTLSTAWMRGTSGWCGSEGYAIGPARRRRAGVLLTIRARPGRQLLVHPANIYAYIDERRRWRSPKQAAAALRQACRTVTQSCAVPAGPPCLARP